MKTILVKTQKELDALPDKFDELTIIEIRSNPDNLIHVTKAWESSRVEAWGSSRVEARGSSRVEARGSSRVEAFGSSRVVARDSSRVEAWDSSRVHAAEQAIIHVHSSDVVVLALLHYAVLMLRVKKVKPKKKDKTATVINAQKEVVWSKDQFFSMCDDETKTSVTLYKSVNPDTICDFYTGKIKYEGVVECHDFNPDPKVECGGGLHLSPTPEQALGYNIGKVLRCNVMK